MNVLVAGSAKCVWDDIRSLGGMELNAIVAVNRMVKDYPLKPTYGVSVHHEQANDFRRDGVPMVCPKLSAGVDIAYDQAPFCKGTSAFYGVGFALLIGASKVIVAGAPIDDSPHYYEGPGIGPDIAVYRDPWRQSLEMLRGRVFSLSGWTRELLGSPL